jgi:hypothetical protein
LLLQSTDGAWYFAAASWNDPTQPVAENRFEELMTALLKFAGPQKYRGANGSAPDTRAGARPLVVRVIPRHTSPHLD